MNNEDITLVLDALQRTYQGKRIDKFKCVVKCPICGEGSKEHSHGHCYVGLIKNHPPLVYHCFINECSGIVTPDFLRSKDIYDTELENILNIFNSSYASMKNEDKKKYFINKKKKDLIIPDIKDSELSFYKLKYMIYRLGIRFTYEDMKNLKVVFSLKDFLEVNQIYPNLKYNKYLDLIDHDYLGFVSNSSEYIVFRNTRISDNLRYIKYNIFNQDDTSDIMYTIPTTANLFDNTINLNICEGPFDALGIYYHLYNKNRYNNIYCACCGSGYVAAIKNIIRKGFIGNLKVNIYSDADKTPKYYNQIKLVKEIAPWVKSIDLYYNQLSKDYGVHANQIELSRSSAYALR